MTGTGGPKSEEKVSLGSSDQGRAENKGVTYEGHALSACSE